MKLRIEIKDEDKKYIEIYKQIKSQIINGKLKPLEKLPSKRVLKETLNVSSNTIMNAYNLLIDEEYIYAVEKKGYYVNGNRNYKSEVKPLKKDITPDYLYDFTSENISKSLFPFHTFKKVTSSILNDDKSVWLTKSPSKGDVGLRKTICDYLYQNKGMNISYHNIIIVSSLEDSLKIINSLIEIKEVGVEEYSYQAFANFYKKQGKEIRYLKMDEKGVKIEGESDLLFLSPYNQFPLGITMSSNRKYEVLNSKVKYILEDDYDLDILNNKKVIATLYSLNSEKVFYHGSFAHSICPGIRISYLVIPSKFLDKLPNTPNNVSSLDQRILDNFIKNGHYFRHLNKLKKNLKEYKEMIRGLLANNDLINYKENNLSFIITIKKQFDVNKLTSELKERRIKIRLLNEFSINDDNRLILSYFALEKEKIEEGIKSLFKAIEASLVNL